MALAVYLAVDGDATEIAQAVAQVQALVARDPTDTRSPLVWLQDVLTSVVEEYLRNAAAVAARTALPALTRLATPPDPTTTAPDWADVADEQERLRTFYRQRQSAPSSSPAPAPAPAS